MHLLSHYYSIMEWHGPSCLCVCTCVCCFDCGTMITTDILCCLYNFKNIMFKGYSLSSTISAILYQAILHTSASPFSTQHCYSLFFWSLRKIDSFLFSRAHNMNGNRYFSLYAWFNSVRDVLSSTLRLNNPALFCSLSDSSDSSFSAANFPARSGWHLTTPSFVESS